MKIVKIIVSTLFLLLIFFLVSWHFKFLLLIVTVLLWRSRLLGLMPEKWRGSRGRAALGGVLLALGCGGILSLPRYGFDPQARVNVLYAGSDGKVKTSHFLSYLGNALLPENDVRKLGVAFLNWAPGLNYVSGEDLNLVPSAHSAAMWNAWLGNRTIPFYLIKPRNFNAKRSYPLAIFLDDENGNFSNAPQALGRLDDCVVMCLSGRERYSSAWRALFKGIISGLAQLGCKVNQSAVTLINYGPGQQLLASAVKSKAFPVANVVLVNSPVDTVLVQGCRRMIVMNDDNGAMRQDVAESLENHEIDYDIIKVPFHDRDLYNHRNRLASILNRYIFALDTEFPVAQSKLQWATDFIKHRYYDKNYVIFVDFSIPSGKNRFFVYQVKTGKIIARSLCAHGCGLGSTEARPVFSNDDDSRCSSLGKYEVIDSKKMNKDPRKEAVFINGQDSTNDNAFDRGILIHAGLEYRNPIYPQYYPIGDLSEGCFAINEVVYRKVAALADACRLPILMLAYD